jgi:hypothetical protein
MAKMVIGVAVMAVAATNDGQVKMVVGGTGGNFMGWVRHHSLVVGCIRFGHPTTKNCGRMWSSDGFFKEFLTTIHCS